MVPHGSICTYQWPTLLYRSCGFIAWQVQRLSQQHLPQHGPSECCFYLMIPICWLWPKHMLGLAGPVHKPEKNVVTNQEDTPFPGYKRDPFFKVPYIHFFFFVLFPFFSRLLVEIFRGMLLWFSFFFFCENFASNLCLLHMMLFCTRRWFFVHLSCLGFCTPL